MKTMILVLIALSGCLATSVDGAPPVDELPPPPELSYPTAGVGLDDNGNAIAFMTIADYAELRAQIEHARIWMRHAEQTIDACTVEPIQ